MDEPLQGIGARYGMRTARFVATQLEYPSQDGLDEKAALTIAINQPRRR